MSDYHQSEDLDFIKNVIQIEEENEISMNQSMYSNTSQKE